MSFSPGSIVRARAREWVVLPESEGDWLMLRPLGGADRQVTGLFLPLEGEAVTQATFPLPNPDEAGDAFSGHLLRDAVRLGVRASAGPFRSFARIAVEPRPYQLVPLLLALRHEVVRMLIADDVGIGKTIEAALIARELLDRGEIRRTCVLCPPHLAEQWQSELREKFHIDAALVLASTVGRLERETAVGQSLFELHPHVVVSTDYIKSPRRREEFVRSCPELVIVDEAHGCAAAPDRRRGGQHQRHELVSRLAEDRSRHLLLVTATPHSGNEAAFRSLLGLLDPALLDLPEDLGGRENESARRLVAQHVVQRRRADVRQYLDADTEFPTREEAETSYALGAGYRDLFQQALDYAREQVRDESGGGFQQRVRWWSALALLRTLASSPAAAAATLRSRSATVGARSEEEVDEIGARAVLDLEIDDTTEFVDTVPGSLIAGAEELEAEAAEAEGGPTIGGATDEATTTRAATDEGIVLGAAHRRRLLRMAAAAEELFGPEHDAKLARLIDIVRSLLADGFQPIVFCRFIATAEYVAEHLRAATRGVEVDAVTGTLPPAERELRVRRLGEHDKRVLVATDCLSEGVNLQDLFSAVVHYDLSWNPTIHEQREGRVDRYGQPRDVVRALTLYGTDNQIDGVVLGVLLRKHKDIRSSLGISVPVPANSGDLMEALMHGLLLRGDPVDPAQLALFDLAGDAYQDLHLRWDDVAKRESASRTLFAQRTIDVDEVAREWQAMRAAIGTHEDVRRFVGAAFVAHGGVAAKAAAGLRLELPAGLRALREAITAGSPVEPPLHACFELPAPDGTVFLGRTHPLVAGLAGYVFDTAMDPHADGVARRCGAIRTRAVTTRTTLLVLRIRHRLERGDGHPLLAEECSTAAFEGAPERAHWLEHEAAEALLAAEPDANIAGAQIRDFCAKVVDGFDALRPALEAHARERAAALGAAHERVRAAGRLRGGAVTVEPHLPVDVLGFYVLLPAGG